MKRYIFGFVLGFLLLGIGSMTIVFEITDFQFKKDIDTEVFEQETKTKEINMTDRVKLYIYGDREDINITTDDNLNDTVIIKYSYYNEFIEPKITDYDNQNFIELFIYKDYFYRRSVNRDIFKLIKNDFKNKSISDYRELFKIKTEIIISSANRNKITLKATY